MKIFPDVITTSYIISQVLGFVSLIILCVGYFLNKDKLLFTQILGNGINAVAVIVLVVIFCGRNWVNIVHNKMLNFLFV